jgi:hypothetical protein
MLSPDEFSVGTLSAATGRTLVIPRSRYDYPMLVLPVGDIRMAVLLSGGREYQAFDCTTNEHQKGMLVRDVQVEVDETSLFDPDHDGLPYGAAIRSGDSLSIVANQQDRFGFTPQRLIPMIGDLPMLQERMQAGFRRWQITVGVGLDKRVLRLVELEKRSE